ncbi:MAG: hypothetical protein FJX72_08175 [Armatimonadetes bacterium]|nr:hypothetical protein [Armatimonadota bacterium]
MLGLLLVLVFVTTLATPADAPTFEDEDEYEYEYEYEYEQGRRCGTLKRARTLTARRETPIAAETRSHSRPPTVRTVFGLWFPLAVSFELMMLEGPAFHGAIGRLADPALNLAAWGLAMSLSLLIESPVIMLLGTSVALARDGASFLALRRFTVRLCFACTILTALVAFTPLFDLVALRIMGQPRDIAEAARPAMGIMLLWTAAIGWRRFYQGVLVRHGQTRWVSYGTAIRLASAVGVAVWLVRLGTLSGVQVAAIAIMAAVLSEAAASTVFARPTLVRDVLPHRDPDAEPLTDRAIWRFHLPLAATTLLMLLSQPLTAAALARLDDPASALAAWPVAFMILLVIRGGGLAYQEITVAQARDPRAAQALRRVAWALGLVGTGAAILTVASPLLDGYLRYVVHAPRSLYGLVAVGVAVGAATPLLTALGAWARGRLMAAGRTNDIYRGMVLSLASQVAALAAGVAFRLPPMWVAAGAMTIAAAVEYAYLARRAGPYFCRRQDAFTSRARALPYPATAARRPPSGRP